MDYDSFLEGALWSAWHRWSPLWTHGTPLNATDSLILSYNYRVSPTTHVLGFWHYFGHAGSFSRRGLARKSRVPWHSFEGCSFWAPSSFLCFQSPLGGQPCPLQIFMTFCLTRAQRWHSHPTTD